VQHNEKADWIRREEKQEIKNMISMAIRLTETASFLSKTRNWKSPGSDKIPNYWLKAFPATHSCIMKIFITMTEEPKRMSDWLTTGTTYLLPISYGAKEPKHFRPNTCLSNMYKMLTGITARKNHHTERS